MKKRKILAMLFAVAICAFALCGCRANVDYYYSSNGNTVTTKYVVTVPSSVVTELEKTAAADTSFPQTKWTFKSYFTTLGKAFGCGVTVDDSTDDTVVTLARTFTPTSDGDDDEENYTREIEKHFFNYKITYTQDSPFDGLRAQYDGTAEITPNTVMDVLVNGVTGVIPGIKTAFPSVAKYTAGDLTLSFCWNADVTPINGETVVADGKKWVKWTAKFDADKQVISYSYTRPNPLGWYVVIFGIGVVTVAIVLLATSKSKAEPKMVELKKGPVRYHAEPDGTIRGDDGSVYRNPYVRRTYHLGDDRNPYRPSESDAMRARRELEDIFSGHDPAEDEKERLKRRLDELLPPDEAEEAKKKLDEKK